MHANDCEEKESTYFCRKFVYVFPSPIRIKFNRVLAFAVEVFIEILKILVES